MGGAGEGHVVDGGEGGQWELGRTVERWVVEAEVKGGGRTRKEG